MAHDALAGLTNLLEIKINAPIKNGELPYHFFYGLKNLTAILLSRSALDRIPPKWLDGLVSLERIYLGNNNLQTLPLGLFDGLRSLEHVGLNSNPWHCSCELSWLLDWSNITGFIFVMFNNINWVVSLTFPLFSTTNVFDILLAYLEGERFQKIGSTFMEILMQ